MACTHDPCRNHSECLVLELSKLRTTLATREKQIKQLFGFVKWSVDHCNRCVTEEIIDIVEAGLPGLGIKE